MSKTRLSLSERIAERAKKTKKQARGGANRAAFLAQRDEIANAIGDGWPIKDIWQTLCEEGSISFSYDAFINYVRKLITDKKQSPSGSLPKTLAAKQITEPAVPVPKPNQTPGFEFDPRRKRSKEQPHD